MDRHSLSSWLERVHANIQARQLLPDRAKILVAVSGGLDSMVLLRTLYDLAVMRHWSLTVAHFNHQLRGAAADADEKLVRQTARRLQLAFVTERGDVAGYAAKAGISIEMAARRLRHQFLAKSARRRGIRLVALAHHADDQVELFFLRFFRGAGGQGMGGMKWSNPSPEDPRVTLVRPLLNQSRESIAAVAQAAGISFSEDTTNACIDILRNRIRHQLLPVIRKEYQPQLSETVRRIMEITGAEAEVVADLAAAWLKDPEPEVFDKLPTAVQRRVLQKQFHERGASSEFELIERLRLNPGRRVMFAAKQFVSRNANGLLEWGKGGSFSFASARQEFELTGKEGRIDFAGKTIAWKQKDRRGGGGAEYFDADQIGPSVCLRHWKPGDRFHPIGAPASSKLQDLFTNLKIPRPRRHRLLVATTAGGEIFWVEGVRIGEGFKITDRTRRVLEWRLKNQKSKKAKNQVYSLAHCEGNP